MRKIMLITAVGFLSASLYAGDILRPIDRELLQQHSDTDAIRLLLDQGANVNAADPSYMMTPLHLAAANGQRQVVDLLLRRGQIHPCKLLLMMVFLELRQSWLGMPVMMT